MPRSGECHVEHQSRHGAPQRFGAFRRDHLVLIGGNDRHRNLAGAEQLGGAEVVAKQPDTAAKGNAAPGRGNESTA